MRIAFVFLVFVSSLTAQSLTSSCTECEAGAQVVFTGAGYQPIKGNKEYGACVTAPFGSWCFAIAPPNESGVVSFIIGTASGAVGPWQVCTVIAQRNKPVTYLVCVGFTTVQAGVQ